VQSRHLLRAFAPTHRFRRRLRLKLLLKKRPANADRTREKGHGPERGDDHRHPKAIWHINAWKSRILTITGRRGERASGT
jgi:hypothetical protein